MIYIMLFPIFFPIDAGLFLLFMKEPEDRKVLIGITGTALAITGVSAAYALFHVNGEAIILFYFTVTLPIYFKPDNIGILFAAVVTANWGVAGYVPFSYMETRHGQREAGAKRV